MPILHLSEQTWTELEALDRDRLVAILPVGATEAHGPHLPVSTDGVIAGAMAWRAAEILTESGWTVLLLPALDYSPAPFAAGFAGTISLRSETSVGILVDIGVSLARHAIPQLAIANAHLDPANLEALRRAFHQLASLAPALSITFPDVTRRPLALRLGGEFLSGACHAGSYEGSMVLAVRPDLVRDEVRRKLPANPSSLSTAIRAGITSFEEAGGPLAYFGDPPAATAAEGRERIDTLGAILAEAVLDSCLDTPETGL